MYPPQGPGGLFRIAPLAGSLLTYDSPNAFVIYFSRSTSGDCSQSRLPHSVYNESLPTAEPVDCWRPRTSRGEVPEYYRCGNTPCFMVTDPAWVLEQDEKEQKVRMGVFWVLIFISLATGCLMLRHEHNLEGGLRDRWRRYRDLLSSEGRGNGMQLSRFPSGGVSLEELARAREINARALRTCRGPAAGPATGSDVSDALARRLARAQQLRGHGSSEPIPAPVTGSGGGEWLPGDGGGGRRGPIGACFCNLARPYSVQPS